MRVKSVLLPVLMQDPSVFGDGKLKLNAIHPVVASDPGGFKDGPVCRRVAVVDVDGMSGELREPAHVKATSGIYRNVGSYRVTIPLPASMRTAPWIDKKSTTSINVLAEPGYDDPFLKVSAFGSVLRTLAFVEDVAVLGRRVKWAFDGEQLLIVPRAGLLDNAFYHRESHSLYFFYFTPPLRNTTYCALSQDIVVHEATHAIVDGIAPALFNASSPHSLALHEGIADFTAVLASLRNRELPPVEDRKNRKAIRELLESSRFSRVAEEFELARSGRKALRDVCNQKTLADVDGADPHALGEVLSGALFEIMRRTFSRAAAKPESQRAERLTQAGGLFGLRAYVVLRMGGLVYKGLDWLPPGEVSFADYGRAMLAADSYYWPQFAEQRKWLLEEFRRRLIFGREATTNTPRTVDASEFDRMPESDRARRRFVEAHRNILGIPPGRRFTVEAYLGAPRLSELSRHTSSESAKLGKPEHQPFDHHPLLLLKVGFRGTESNDLGRIFGRKRSFTTGTTVAFDQNGVVHGLLLGGRDRQLRIGRSKFLQRLAASGALRPPGRTLGPDGKPLQGYVTSDLRGGTLHIAGAFRALHLVETV